MTEQGTGRGVDRLNVCRIWPMGRRFGPRSVFHDIFSPCIAGCVVTFCNRGLQAGKTDFEAFLSTYRSHWRACLYKTSRCASLIQCLTDTWSFSNATAVAFPLYTYTQHVTSTCRPITFASGVFLLTNRHDVFPRVSPPKHPYQGGHLSWRGILHGYRHHFRQSLFAL